MKPEILRNIFLVVFIASSTVLLLLFGPITGDVFSTINSSLTTVTEQPGIISTPEPGGDDPSSTPSTSRDSGALIGTIFTSVTSLVGFATTTVITLRKEKREASLADVERKKLETELEKSKLELEELKKRSEKKEKRSKK